MMDFTNTLEEWATYLKDAPVEELTTSYLIGASSHKLEVSNKAMGGRFLSSILYLLQDNLSGINVCPWATKSCRDICLGTHSGHACMVKTGNVTNHVQIARMKRTILFAKHREVFMAILSKEVGALVRKAEKKEVTPAFRFNGTSDLPLENYGILEKFPMVQFYDYTKSLKRMKSFLNGDMPTNYHLTFSYTPENEDKALEVLQLGGNVAVVFNEKLRKSKGERLTPSFVGKTFLGSEVVDGDLHDLRFDDPQGGYVIGLTRKGRLKDMDMFLNPERALDNLKIAV